MTTPDVLQSDRPLLWSPGTGTEVWAMLCACRDGDLETVQRLVAQNPALVRCQHSYRKPLYFAVRENRLAVTAFLLERDPDPIGLAINDSLLEIAADRGHAEMGQLLETTLAARFNASAKGEAAAALIRAGDAEGLAVLFDRNPDLLHAGDLRGNQPLHWAAMTRQPVLIDEFVRRGADVNAKRIDGARPIQLTNGDYHFRGWRDVPADHPVTPRAVLDHLRRLGAWCDLNTAAHIGDMDRVRELLDGDATLANRAWDYVSYYPCSGTPLRNAAAAGHLEIVKLLLVHGADPNLPEEGIAPHGHALYSAVAAGHYEIAELLLEHGAFANPEVESSADALTRAISNGDKRMTALLCARGAARGVHLLAYENDLQTAAAVFAANPALADDPEALANAAGEGHGDFVRLMLRYHPDLPRRATFPGWLMAAKTLELNELLFAHGMNPSTPDWLGITPLHHLARKGDTERAAFFLKHGADIHARDEDLCSTPLGWAAKFGQRDMVELLLDHGAAVQHPDDPAWATPAAWARRRGHADIAERLEQAAGGTVS